jgi:pimeloyl-ACP methyl ester carboxylesterase
LKKLIKKRIALVLALCLGVFLLALAFIYLVMPGMVAASIATSSRKPPERTPASYHLNYEDVAIPADGGVTLAAWFLPAQRTGSKGPVLGTVLMSHGVFHNREQVLERAGFLARAGYRILLFDLRGHGASTKAFLSGGVGEAADFTAAARFLEGTGREVKPRILFGLSLSSMAAMYALGGGLQAEALIADSPLPNGSSWVSRRTLGGMFMGLPGFFDACVRAYDRRTGLSLKASDLDLMPVARKIHVPVMIITGEKDDLAGAQDVRKLFEASESRFRRLIYVPEAGHDETYQKFRIMYERGVLEFLKQVREGFPKTPNSIRQKHQ